MTGRRNSTGPVSWRRRAGAVSAGFASTVLCAAPAYAHGSVTMTVHSDGRGSVWLTAAWSDNHPITDPIGAILTGTSSTGAQVGPVPLKQNGDALTYTGDLAPGDWTLTAEMGTPAIGRCAATVHVVAVTDPAPSPAAVTCAPSAEPEPVAAPSTSDSSAVWYRLAAIAGVLVAVGAGLRVRVSGARAAARRGSPRAGSRRP